MKLNQDLHIHTWCSPCGQPENTLEGIAGALDRAGMIVAGLADHIDLPSRRAWLREVAANHRRGLAGIRSFCHIYVGAEVTMLSPTRCAIDAELAAELDYVLISCNHYHLEAVERPRFRNALAYGDHALHMMQGALATGFASAIAHPFLNLYADRDLAFETLASYNLGKLSGLLREAAHRNTAFEINPYIVRHAIEWFRDFVSEARRFGVKFVLGSDAHNLEKVGFGAPCNGLTPEKTCQAIGLRPDDLARL